MSIFKVFALLALSMAVSSQGPAVLAQEAAIQGKPEVTDYSGKGASQKRNLTKLGTENDAIVGIEAGEQSDDPCFLRVAFRDVTTGSNSSLLFDDCGAQEGDVEGLSLPEGAFATGVRVCLNSEGDKIKGVQLIGSYGGCVLGAEFVYVAPSECSSVVKISGHDYRLCDSDPPAVITRSCEGGISPHFERANCVGSNSGQPDSDWEATVRCPEGEVATGIKLNTREGGGDRRMYNGIAVECYELAED